MEQSTIDSFILYLLRAMSLITSAINGCGSFTQKILCICLRYKRVDALPAGKCDQSLCINVVNLKLRFQEFSSTFVHQNIVFLSQFLFLKTLVACWHSNMLLFSECNKIHDHWLVSHNFVCIYVAFIWFKKKKTSLLDSKNLISSKIIIFSTYFFSRNV